MELTLGEPHPTWGEEDPAIIEAGESFLAGRELADVGDLEGAMLEYKKALQRLEND